MAIWQASRPTVIDSEIWGRYFRIKGSDFSFGRGWGPQKGFRCCPIVAFSFFCLFHPWVFENSCFCSRPPFRIFTLESYFSFFLSFSFFDCPITHLKIHPKQVNGLSRIFAEGKRQHLYWLQKISQGRKSSVQVSTFNQNGLFRYVMWAKVHGFERKDR